MFIVGIDVAKRNHEVTIITSEGQVVCKGFRISNTCTGYNRMMERLGKLTNLKSQFIFAMDSTFCKTSLAVLAKYPTPDKLSRAQLGKLTEVLQKSSNGRFGEWKAREIKELARGSFGVADCEGVYSTLIQLFLEQILDYFLIKLYNLFRYGLLSPFRMVCRDFILPETCKPCLVLSFFQFAKIIVPYRAKRGTTTKTTEKKTDGLRK